MVIYVPDRANSMANETPLRMKGLCLINAVVSMGRRNTQLEPTLH
jgi:hypothetical protein